MESKIEYITGVWNMIDVLSITVYLVAFITRFIVLEPVFALSK